MSPESAPEIPVAPKRASRRVALILSLLLGVGLLLAAGQATPGLLDEFGYRIQSRRGVGGPWLLTVVTEVRRADWLPIPPERRSLVNLRGEVIARIPPPVNATWRGYYIKWDGSYVVFGSGDWSIELAIDGEGVLVNAAEVIPPEKPPEAAYTGFDGLRLHPDGE